MNIILHFTYKFTEKKTKQKHIQEMLIHIITIKGCHEKTKKMKRETKFIKVYNICTFHNPRLLTEVSEQVETNPLNVKSIC